MNSENYISKGWSRPVQHFIKYHKCKHLKFAFESQFEHINIRNLQKLMNISFYSDTDSKGTKETKQVYWWRKKEPPVLNLLEIDPFSQPPENVDKWTPLTYFRKFWSDDITERLVDQTNLYSVEKTGESIKTTKEEMERFIGVQMLMSIVKLPRYEMYWSLETHVEQVTSLFSLKRYKKLREFLNIVDNAEKEKEGNKDDTLFKVKPLLDAVRADCLKTEPELIHSIDEQIIPAKTKQSGGVHQYNPKNPT